MEKDGTPFGLSNHSRAGSAFIFATAASESRESLSLAAGRRSRHRTLINLCGGRHQSGRNLISWTGVITLAIVRWNQPARAESCRHCWDFLDEAAPLVGVVNIIWVVRGAVSVLGEPPFLGAAANKSRLAGNCGSAAAGDSLL